MSSFAGISIAGDAQWHRPATGQHVDELGRELAAARNRLADLPAPVTDLTPLLDWVQFADDTEGGPTSPGSWWDQLPLEEKRRLLAAAIDHIEVRPALRRRPPMHERITIHWAEPAG